ncbi:MurR/RpiR family transcriptional regulator [Fusobacterium ulcerans]|uniref:MurR/RpiR family transcriptional regulator n=1 Tax=Fusobacterium ulcerans TaxID=861 RepID=UPI0024201CA0|nr:MurR/RpiR family transcriptional regulator [Fusobacterium ulcerans]
MKTTIENSSYKSDLTNKDKIILDYILRNKKTACFLTSNEIAELLNVSPSSVVRLSKKIGFENFSAFKKALQMEIAEQEPSLDANEIPYEKIEQYDKLSDIELIKAFRQNVLKNITADISSKEDKKFIESADIISKAKRVFIVGYRTCAGLASTFGIMLSCIRPDVFVLNNNGPIVDRLIDLGKNDVVVAISFNRYSGNTKFAVQIARDAGAKIISFTDFYTSPIAQGVDKVIINSVENFSFYNSYASSMMNIETIVALVSKKNIAANKKRLMKMETYLEQNGEY